MKPTASLKLSSLIALTAAVLCAGAAALSAADPADNAKPVKRQTITIEGFTHELFTPEELKERGLPYREIEPEKNAATWYLRAFEKFDKDRRGNEAVWAQQAHVTDYGFAGPMPELSAYLKANAEAIELFKKGAATEDYQFPMLYSESILGLPLPHLGLLRQGARLVACDAMRLASEGKTDEAIDSCLAVFNLGAHVAKEPVMISGLVGLSCVGTGQQTLATLVQRYPLTQEQFERIAKFLTDFPKRRPDYRLAVRSERMYFGNLAIKEAFEGRGGGIFGLARAANGGGGGGSGEAFEQWSDNLLESVGGHRALRIVLPDRAVIKHGNAFYDKAETLADAPAWKAIETRNSGDAAMLADIPVWNTLTVLIAPAVIQVRVSYAVNEAQMEMLRTLVAVHLYAKRHNGQFPGQLKDLVPKELAAVPVDPFDRTGQTVVYRPDAKGFLLYCLGSDLKDDGGKLGGIREKGTDYGFRFPPEPAPPAPAGAGH